MFWTIRFGKKQRILAAICAGILCVSGVLYAADQPRASDAGDPLSGGVSLPIIMYHGLLKEEARQGAYVISPVLFEEDLLYIQQHGYTTIVMQDLLDYVQGGKPLPEKPIMLTFDDGYYNNYVYAFPLLKKYGQKIVLSPIGRFADEYTQSGDLKPNYAHIPWPLLRDMVDSGLVEVQNHTYNMHSPTASPRKGAQKMKGETSEQYRQSLNEDIGRMQQRMEEELGAKATTFTYPFGAVSPESVPILREMGFEATLVCESHLNRITRDPACLYGLGRYLRASGMSAEQFFTQKLKLA